MPTKPHMVDPAASPWASQSTREREREIKREAVLRTAARLFNAKGYHATSLDEVAQALKVTKPTIYHYFSNKDEVLFECTRRGLDAIETAVRQASAQGGSAAERLGTLLTAYALCMLDDYGICVARTLDNQLSPESRKEFRRLKRQIDGQLRQVIREGVDDGSLAAPDVRIASFTLGLALNGLGNWYQPGGALSAEEVAARTVASLLNGLRWRDAPDRPAP